MKILLVTPYFYPKIGGVENYTYHLARQLERDHGYEVVIVTSSERGEKSSQTKIGGLKVYRLGYRFKFSNTPIGFGWFSEIRRIIQTEQPELINAHSPVPFMADVAQLASGKLPFVITYHAGSMKKGKPAIDAVIRVYETLVLGRVFRKAKRIIAVSPQYAADELGRYAEKLDLIQPGVDISAFTPKPKKTKNQVLYIGRIERSSDWKGIPYLLEAIAELAPKQPSLQLTLVGDGDGVEYYRRQAAQLGIADQVVFAGQQHGADLHAALHNANVLVLPSTSESESFGIVLIEAMASGTPVIGSNIGGIPSVIDDGVSGLLVEPKDSVGLAKAIDRVLHDSALAKRLAAAGRSKVIGSFQWSSQTAKTAAVFEQAHRSKIVQITPYYPPHLGGLENVAFELAEGLHRTRSVEVITSNVPKQSTSVLRAHNRVTRRLRSFEFAHTPVLPGLLPRLLIQSKDSVFHIHLSIVGVPEVAILAAKLRGIPTVLHFHLDVDPSGRLGFLLAGYKRLLLPLTMRSGDAVIVFSKTQSKLIQDKYGVDKRRIHIIPNGVGNQFFLDRKASDTSRLKLLCVGRLQQQKRFDRAIEAASKIRHACELTIVGEGEDKAALMQLVRVNKLKNVHFVGQKNHDELLAYYQYSDVLLLPSEKEGMSLVMLEAMASGLPIIASDAVGISEYLRGIGILVKDPSADTFAAAIHELAVHRKTALPKLSEASRKAAEQYSWTKLVSEFEDLYDGLEDSHANK